MITYVIFVMISTIIEQFKEKKSNIISIQEKENNSKHKRGFWDNVPMMLISIWTVVMIVALISLIVYSLFTPVGLKTILPIIVVDIALYVMFNIEVFYKLLYKLFKKNDKEEL